MRLVPSTPAGEFILSTIIIGYLLIDEMTPTEQNSLGNWFMLIGQVLSTNSAQQQVLNNRTHTSNRSNRHVVNDGFGEDYENKDDTKQQMEMLKRAIEKMRQEIDNLNKLKNYPHSL